MLNRAAEDIEFRETLIRQAAELTDVHDLSPDEKTLLFSCVHLALEEAGFNVRGVRSFLREHGTPSARRRSVSATVGERIQGDAEPPSHQGHRVPRDSDKAAGQLTDVHDLSPDEKTLLFSFVAWRSRRRASTSEAFARTFATTARPSAS